MPKPIDTGATQREQPELLLTWLFQHITFIALADVMLLSGLDDIT